MDPSDAAEGSLDDNASSSAGASSVDYISEVSDAESTASEAAAAALEDVIDAVERRVDRQRRRAALRRFVRRVLRTTVRAALLCILGLVAAAAAVALERERGRWLTRCPLHAPCSEETFPCVGAVTEPFAIPRGRVNDGVVDCCGGSDEFGGDVSVCMRDAQQQLEEARREVTSMEASMAARRVLAEEAPFAAARAAVEDAQLRSDELRFSELQPRSYHEAAQLQAVRQKIQRLRVHAAGAYHQDPDVYGDDGAWLALRGACFDSPPLTEKSVRGGVEARDGAARSGCPHTGPRRHFQRDRKSLCVSSVSIQKRDAARGGPHGVEAGDGPGRGQKNETLRSTGARRPRRVPGLGING